MPLSSSSCLAQALLLSMRAAAAVGPNTFSPCAAKISTIPPPSGSSGPMIVRSMACPAAHSAAAARIESSKAWAKQLLLDNGIPTAQATRFTDYAAAEAALRERETKGAFPVVIKADGLAAGKGVVIAHD